VFSALNVGEAVTKGLKKVVKGETPPLARTGSSGSGMVLLSYILVALLIAFSAAPKKPAKPTKPPSLAGKKPSRFELEGNKWVIVRISNFPGIFPNPFAFQEYHEDETNLVVENTEINQIVNIYGCKKSTIQIRGKVNAITLGQYLPSTRPQKKLV
jgi:adenylyl cyclase-associated protein